jgi:hypothetical protein
MQFPRITTMPMSFRSVADFSSTVSSKTCGQEDDHNSERDNSKKLWTHHVQKLIVTPKDPRDLATGIELDRQMLVHIPEKISIHQT